MKIILLRHGERDINNPLFFSKLTDEGMIKSKLLVKELNKYNINTIYASPFLRVLQTIYPYCKSNNINVNVNNLLYESMDDIKFNDNNSHFNYKDLPNKYIEIINTIYSNNKLYKIKRNESFIDIKNRVKPFINEILINDDEILFDSDPKQFNWLHYKNGKLNLYTKEFCKRDMGDKVTQRLPYDYHTNVPDEIYEEVENASMRSVKMTRKDFKQFYRGKDGSRIY